MKKKAASVVLAGAMALSLAVGCTPVFAGETEAAATGGATLNPNTKNAEELTLWHYFDAAADAKAIIDFANEYNELQDKVYINPTYVARQELMNQYTIGAVSGELPDIGMVDSPDMESYISLGVFEDVTKQLGDWEDLDKFFPGPLSSCKDSDGKIYGLPQNSNCLTLAANMDALKEAGIDKLPTSLDEFKEDVEKATNSDKSQFGFAMCAISTEEGTFQLLPWIVATHDGTKTSLTNLTDEKAAIGLDVLGGFVKNGQMSPECVNWTQADAYNQFCAGKAAFAEIGTWHLASIDNDVNGAFKYQITTLPTGDEGTSSSTIGGENFGVCTGCKDVDEAVNFLKWFMSKDSEERWAVQSGKLATRSDASPVYTYQEDNFKVFQKQMDTALARGPHDQWPTISEQIYTAAQKVFLNGDSAADALKAANDVITPILESDPLPEQ